jgi:hypothetical protein
MEDPATNFSPSSEQQETISLVQEFLGPAVAARYEDFCRLSAGVFDLNVTIPLAAHALREMESLLRSVLMGLLEVSIDEEPAQIEKVSKVQELLVSLQYDEDAIERAVKALTPQTTHAKEIRKIVEWLGLDPQGDIAKLWISLTKTNRIVHSRSFHKTLNVDENFRAKFQRPFDTVIREVVIRFRGRYAAPMQRVRGLAASSDRARAVKTFKGEIPGALPLQWHFYQHLTTEDWLPHLAKEDLLGEPIKYLPQGEGNGRYFGEWPVGSYILRMAASPTEATRRLVIKALQAVRQSDHPDVSQVGIEILAALPPAEAALVTDIAVGWLNRDSGPLRSQAALDLIKRLAGAGKSESAMKIGREVLRLRNNNGRIASHFDQSMYEHHLPDITVWLTEACGSQALQLFIDLLRDAQNITDNNYSHYSNQSIAEHSYPPSDIFEALLIAVRQSSEILIRGHAMGAGDVFALLRREPADIFVRLALHALSLDPSSAPELATAQLVDEVLIEQAWSNAEYSALARNWFPSLSAEEQSKILRVIDASPDKDLDWWMQRFEQETKKPASAEDIQRFKGNCIRNICWKWRTVLPQDRREAMEKLGDPDAWHHTFSLADESPLTEADFSGKAVPEIIAVLKEWRPGPEPSRQTVTALAQEVRTAAVENPRKYADAADQFVSLKPIYVRRLLEGFQQAASNQKNVNWESLLKLIGGVYEKVGEPIDPANLSPGDDESWEWTRKAASQLLAVGLRLGRRGIPLEHAEVVRELVLATFAIIPAVIDTHDFDTKFEKQPFSTALETSRGIATEVGVLLVRWLNMDLKVTDGPRPAAIAALPVIARALEFQLADRTAAGRVPRAVMGRYLGILYYYDSGWVKSQMTALFPVDDTSLRDATWHSHLLNGFGPINQLMPDLARCYHEEAIRLSVTNDPNDGNGRHVREQRFADYVMCLVLRGVVPVDLLEAFLKNSKGTLLKHAMWFIATEVSKPLSEVPEEARQRGRSYWERRLAAAVASPEPTLFSEELGTISQWCFHGIADESWLYEQLLATLKIGISPNNAYGTIEWIQKLGAHSIDQAVEVFLELIRCPAVKRWSYTANLGPLHDVLAGGIKNGTSDTKTRVREAINYLASIGVDFLDLDPPPAGQ